MTVLKVGDRVMDLTGSHEGRLVDVDGGTGYVLQPNGVEIEFPLDRLKPYEAPKVATVRTLSGPLRDVALSPERKALLAAVPAEILLAVERSYMADGAGERPAFAALPDGKRLEVIRVYLPSLPQRLLVPHMRLVVAMRDMDRPRR